MTGERTPASIRRMRADDLDMVLAWRNAPSVRSMMFNPDVIERTQHQSWFEQTSLAVRRALLIVAWEDEPLGFVQFDGVEPGGVSDWGFYARPGAPRGSGRILGRTALDHGFGALQLHKICGRAIAFNTASIRLHARLGFQQEGLLREQHRIDGVHHSVLCFGLLRHEWQATGNEHPQNPFPQSEERAK